MVSDGEYYFSIVLQADETGKFQDSAFLNAVVKVILTFDFSCRDQSGGLNMKHDFFFLWHFSQE